MTTTTPPSGATFAHAAAMVAGYLADHALPEPASLSVITSYGHSTVTAQLDGTTLHGVGGGLIAWADTVSMVTVEAWRPPERDRTHLSILGTLTGPADTVELKVFGGVEYDPLRFADLQPHKCQGMPLSLGQLRTWATNHSTTIGTLVLEASRAAR